MCETVLQVSSCGFSILSTHQRNLKLSGDYKPSQSGVSSPFTAQGSAGHMIPVIGNFTYVTKASLVSMVMVVFKKKNKPS